MLNPTQENNEIYQQHYNLARQHPVLSQLFETDADFESTPLQTESTSVIPEDTSVETEPHISKQRRPKREKATIHHEAEIVVNFLKKAYEEGRTVSTRDIYDAVYPGQKITQQLRNLYAIALKNAQKLLLSENYELIKVNEENKGATKAKEYTLRRGEIIDRQTQPPQAYEDLREETTQYVLTCQKMYLEQHDPAPVYKYSYNGREITLTRKQTKLFSLLLKKKTVGLSKRFINRFYSEEIKQLTEKLNQLLIDDVYVQTADEQSIIDIDPYTNMRKLSVRIKIYNLPFQEREKHFFPIPESRLLALTEFCSQLLQNENVDSEKIIRLLGNTRQGRPLHYQQAGFTLKRHAGNLFTLQQYQKLSDQERIVIELIKETMTAKEIETKEDFYSLIDKKMKSKLLIRGSQEIPLQQEKNEMFEKIKKPLYILLYSMREHSDIISRLTYDYAPSLYSEVINPLLMILDTQISLEESEPKDTINKRKNSIKQILDIVSNPILLDQYLSYPVKENKEQQLIVDFLLYLGHLADIEYKKRNGRSDVHYDPINGTTLIQQIICSTDEERRNTHYTPVRIEHTARTNTPNEETENQDMTSVLVESTYNDEQNADKQNDDLENEDTLLEPDSVQSGIIFESAEHNLLRSKSKEKRNIFSRIPGLLKLVTDAVSEISNNTVFNEPKSSSTITHEYPAIKDRFIRKYNYNRRLKTDTFTRSEVAYFYVIHEMKVNRMLESITPRDKKFLQEFIDAQFKANS